MDSLMDKWEVMQKIIIYIKHPNTMDLEELGKMVNLIGIIIISRRRKRITTIAQGIRPCQFQEKFYRNFTNVSVREELTNERVYKC